MTRPAPSRAASVSAAFAFLVIAAVTLRPYDGNPVQSVPWCLVCGDSGVADVVRNVVLFVPYGAALRATGMRRALLLVLATTVMIELMQYRVIAGREGTLSDVLTNLAGGAIGIAMVDRASSLLHPTRRLAASLAMLSGATALAIMGVTLSAFQLSVPSGRLEVQWAPVRSPMVPFRGRVDSVQINGRPTHAGEIDDAERLVGTEPSHLRIDADVRVRGIADLTSAIVRVEASNGEALFLGARARDVLFTPATRATRWRLNPVRIVLADALAVPGRIDGGPVHLWAVADRGVLGIGAATADAERAWSVLISPALGWSLLSPFYYSMGRDYRWFSLLWMVALWMPLGYWGAWTVTDSRAIAAGFRSAIPPLMTAGIGATLSLRILPAVMGFPTPTWTDWFGVAAGVTVGWLAGGIVRERRARWRDARNATPMPLRPAAPRDAHAIAGDGDKLEGGQPAL
jgi:hypothetical protein